MKRLPWKFFSELVFMVMDKNECKLNCSQATSNCRQLLLSQVTCFIYKDMWATMLLSELKKKKVGGDYMRSHQAKAHESAVVAV